MNMKYKIAWFRNNKVANTFFPFMRISKKIILRKAELI